MKREIEASLRRAVKELPHPDCQRLLHSAVPRMEVHDHVTRQEGRPVPRRRRALAVPVLCALVLCVGLLVYGRYFQTYSVVDLRVNPAFAIALNRGDKVLAIQALNDDAEAFLEGRSYRGWTLETAVWALLDELAARGWLDARADRVDVAVNSRSADHGRALREEVEDYVDRYFAERVLPSPSLQPAAPSPSPAPALLTRSDIEALVLSREPGAAVREIELDEDDGRLIYEVQFWNGAGEAYEAELDALTGAVLKWEED